MVRRTAAFLTLSILTLLAGCGGASGPPYGVNTTMVSEVTTNDVWVWAPDADGSWPVVYAVPGSGGSAQRDLDVIAAELASTGVVVFASDMHGETMWSVESDIECGYRLSRDIAEEYGGDLTQPVTMVGYSFGAAVALRHGLNEENFGPDSSYMPCFEGAPRPDIIVAVNGCYLATLDFSIESDVRFWDNGEAHVLLVSGDSDDVCGTFQSEHADATLGTAGYDVTLVEITDANHWEVVFHDMAYGNYETLPADDPAGQATVHVILDAIEAARR